MSELIPSVKRIHTHLKKKGKEFFLSISFYDHNPNITSSFMPIIPPTRMGGELNIIRGQTPDQVFSQSLQANLPFTHRPVQVMLDPLMFGAPFHWDCSICYCTHAVINKVCRCLQRFVLRCLYLNSELGCELPLRNPEKDLTTHAFLCLFYCFSHNISVH